MPPQSGRRGRPRVPYYRPHDDLQYATLHKTRVRGRVTKIDYRIMFGQPERVVGAFVDAPCAADDYCSSILRSMAMHDSSVKLIMDCEFVNRVSI